jgi:hypothetical protein
MGDIDDLLEVFFIANLARIADERLTVVFPKGFESFINTSVLDSIGRLKFSRDLNEILTDYVLTRRLGDAITPVLPIASVTSV